MLKLDQEKFVDYSENYYLETYHHHRLVYDIKIKQVIGKLPEDIVNSDAYIHLECKNDKAYLYYFHNHKKIYFKINKSGELIPDSNQVPELFIILTIKDNYFSLNTNNLFLRIDRKGFASFSASVQKEWETLTLGNIAFLDKKLTVVVNVKNAEKSLQQLFESISPSFNTSVGILFLVSPSKDNSLNMVRKYQEHYASNVDYYQTTTTEKLVNRNLALPLLQSDWVTYIEADDFYSSDFFNQIEQKLSDPLIGLIVSNSLVFDTVQNKYECRDSQSWRFKQAETVVYKHELKDHFIYSSYGLLFKTAIIKQYSLKFNEHLKHYSGALLSNHYLLVMLDEKIVFLREPHILLRKSPVRTYSPPKDAPKLSQENVDAIKQAFIAVIRQTKQAYQDTIPTYIKQVILYYIAKNIKQNYNKPLSQVFATTDAAQDFLELLVGLAKELTLEELRKFPSLRKLEFFLSGILNLLYQVSPIVVNTYVEKINFESNRLLIKYFSANDVKINILHGNTLVEPVTQKLIHHQYLDKLFIKEKRVWIDFPKAEQQLKILVDNRLTTIHFNNQLFTSGLPHSALKAYQKQLPKPVSTSKYINCWLFMDRDIQADDNAEHLYRYTKRFRKNIYFVLRKDSHDWPRLEQEGFQLIEFASKDHEEALNYCSKLISSHFDYYVTHLFGKNTLSHKQYIFLTHGMILADLSMILNSKNIDLLITSSLLEHHSICHDGSKYKYTTEEAKLLGLPRHDFLIKNKHKYQDKVILVMPTWRTYITGYKVGLTHNRDLNAQFTASDYYKHWKGFLVSAHLKQLCDEFGYRLIFFPHVNIQPYLHLFELPDYIEVRQHLDTSIQELFLKSSLMITDYSSVQFEMALLDKPVIGYHFDRDKVLSHHIAGKGNIDHENEALGPLVTTQNELLSTLQSILANGGQLSPNYLEKIDRFFAHRDGQNCQRVYKAITALG
ncbi:CDP-glycerol glycerophosphotransferase family protein [Alkanindiges illinoisensis]|uniref:CDP-glycerol glycerophosphotransferase family protein n=1 Tax=Alkanindiges illinoisensis TaxID=197183 RepID=UPI00047DD859|nr:CDP-glycerol glycerophosphotransferase family protein [Alkanindiges illinoisensis]